MALMHSETNSGKADDMGSKVTLGGELMFPSDYVAAVEFKGKDVTLTIVSVKLEELVMVGGTKKKKPVVCFAETKKKLVLNKTNADSIAVMYGGEARTWAGKRITLYPTKAKFGREMVDAIRVREVVPQQTETAPEQTAEDNSGAEPEEVGA